MENNEKKRIGRRAVIGSCAMLLIMGCLIYIIESFKHDVELLIIGKDFFSSFTSTTLGIAVFVITGLSVTDAILKKK